jgi:hypothetical protein
MDPSDYRPPPYPLDDGDPSGITSSGARTKPGRCLLLSSTLHHWSCEMRMHSYESSRCFALVSRIKELIRSGKCVAFGPHFIMRLKVEGSPQGRRLSTLSLSKGRRAGLIDLSMKKRGTFSLDKFHFVF